MLDRCGCFDLQIISESLLFVSFKLIQIRRMLSAKGMEKEEDKDVVVCLLENTNLKVDKERVDLREAFGESVQKTSR
jgi:hypothetical protein